MTQGTTPLLELTVDQDISECAIFITLKDVQNDNIYTYTNTDTEFVDMTVLDDTTTIHLRLTQEDTLAMSVGQIDVQVRFINSEGIADATNVRRIVNLEALYTEEISYSSGEG